MGNSCPLQDDQISLETNSRTLSSLLWCHSDSYQYCLYPLYYDRGGYVKEKKDPPQIFGELYLLDEIQDITLIVALALLFELSKSNLKQVLVSSKEKK